MNEREAPFDLLRTFELNRPSSLGAARMPPEAPRWV
jgi:hypothetical protein